MNSVVVVIAIACSCAQPPHALSWEEVCPTPPDWCPQGLAAPDGRLLLSAYRGAEKGSAVFHVRLEGRETGFEKLFDMPAEARHTSGLAEIPGRPDRLFAVDYRSGSIYLLDLPASCRTRKAVVLAECPTGMNGPSACCVARLKSGHWLLLVSEFRLLKAGQNLLFEFHPGPPEARHPGGIDPFVARYQSANPFTNRGRAQGLKFHGGFIYETGNRIGGPSYLVRYRLEDAMAGGRIPEAGVEQFSGPRQWIEDVAFFRGFLWVTDEGRRRLYRTSVPPISDRIALED